MERSSRSPDEFIADLPARVRESVVELDRLISSALPDVSRTLWVGKFWGGTDQCIVGYGDLTYQRSDNKTVEWFIVGLAVQKNHLSLYISAADGDGYLAKRYADRLGKVKVGSGSIAFKSVRDLDLDVVRDLLTTAYKLAGGRGE